MIRIAVGLAFTAAPRMGARLWLGRAHDERFVVAVRSTGARDLALGTGALSAAVGGRDLRAWLLAGAVADAGDALGALRAAHSLTGGRRALLLASATTAAVAGVRLGRASGPTT